MRICTSVCLDLNLRPPVSTRFFILNCHRLFDEGSNLNIIIPWSIDLIVINLQVSRTMTSSIPIVLTLLSLSTTYKYIPSLYASEFRGLARISRISHSWLASMPQRRKYLGVIAGPNFAVAGQMFCI